MVLIYNGKSLFQDREGMKRLLNLFQGESNCIGGIPRTSLKMNSGWPFGLQGKSSLSLFSFPFFFFFPLVVFFFFFIFFLFFFFLFFFYFFFLKYMFCLSFFRFPDTGDHTLITDVIYTDDTDDNNNGLPDTGPYTVLLNNILNRCQQLTIGGSWDQGITEKGIFIGHFFSFFFRCFFIFLFCFVFCFLFFVFCFLFFVLIFEILFGRIEDCF